MNIYSGLLFQQGHIQDPHLALSLASDDRRESRTEKGDASPSKRPARSERRASFRHGAIFAVCSTALSPFR